MSYTEGFVLLLEKDNDIANKTSMANSAIIHAGYDPNDNTLKAEMNIKGARRYPSLCKELKVDYIYSVKKPNPDKISELIKSTKFGLDEVAMIGDSMMDDVVCGNTIGVTTILLDQMSKREYPLARIRRMKEKKIPRLTQNPGISFFICHFLLLCRCFCACKTGVRI